MIAYHVLGMKWRGNIHMAIHLSGAIIGNINYLPGIDTIPIPETRLTVLYSIQQVNGVEHEA